MEYSTLDIPHMRGGEPPRIDYIFLFSTGNYNCRQGGTIIVAWQTSKIKIYLVFYKNPYNIKIKYYPSGEKHGNS